MGYRTLVQLALIGISMVVVFVYIKPTFASISEVQDEIAEYAAVISNVEEFNRQLRQLIQQEQTFSVADREALDRFLPNNIDPLQVMLDLETIIGKTDFKITSLGMGGGDDGDNSQQQVRATSEEMQGSIEESMSLLRYQEFSLDGSGTYDDLKDLLQLLEANAYVFEVADLTLAPVSEEGSENQTVISAVSDGYSVSMTLRVYSLTSVPVDSADGSGTTNNDSFDSVNI